MSVVELVAAVLFFIGCIGAFVCYERLIRRQFEVAHDSWEADGCPPGFVWSAPGTSVMRSWTREKAMHRLLFGRPPWTIDDPVARQLHGRFRAFSLVCLVAWVVGFTAMLLK